MNRIFITVALLVLGLCSAVGSADDPEHPDLLATLTVPKRDILVFGQRIVFYEGGRGKTLLLISNLGWDSNAWAQNFADLARGHHVVAIDLLGTGQSAKPHIDYKMDTWTDVMAEFLRLKGIRKATVVGAVMGGALSVQFALDHPDISEGLVCAASNSGPGKHEGGSPAGGSPSLEGIRRSLRAFFYDKSLITDAVVRARFEQRLNADDGYAIERHMSDHRQPYSVQELSRIHVPALFVWCREDTITPVQWGEDFAAAVPGARLKILESCGHLPNVEVPRAFDSAVLDFLSSTIDKQ